jgi:hypothetical protein
VVVAVQLMLVALEAQVELVVVVKALWVVLEQQRRVT